MPMCDRVYLPTFEGCLVCGQPHVNPQTLNRRFQVTTEGVQVSFQADPRQAGYRGIVHGGIITALLDETIGWAVAVSSKKFFVTGELTVRFVLPLPIGCAVTVFGRSLEHKSKYSIGEGEIKDEKGTLYAKASGKFFHMRHEQALEVNSYLTFQEKDLNILASV